jgi:hypothetical protein
MIFGNQLRGMTEEEKLEVWDNLEVFVERFFDCGDEFDYKPDTPEWKTWNFAVSATILQIEAEQLGTAVVAYSYDVNEEEGLLRDISSRGFSLPELSDHPEEEEENWKEEETDSDEGHLERLDTSNVKAQTSESDEKPTDIILSLEPADKTDDMLGNLMEENPLVEKSVQLKVQASTDNFTTLLQSDAESDADQSDGRAHYPHQEAFEQKQQDTGIL